jgi:hypothetical protein
MPNGQDWVGKRPGFLGIRQLARWRVLVPLTGETVCWILACARRSLEEEEVDGEGSRLRRALKQVVLWCRANRHEPVIEQQRSLNLKLRGHYGYYGITGNFLALQGFWDEVRRVWRRWLDRRSQRARMNWPRFEALRQRYPLAPPRVVQSVYAQRNR